MGRPDRARNSRAFQTDRKEEEKPPLKLPISTRNMWGGEGRGEERRSRENLDLFNFLVRQGIAKRATTVTRYEKNEAFSFRARFDQLARTMVS